MRCPRSRDISSQSCSKIARSRLPRPCLSAYISGTRARIGKRFSPLDRAGQEVSKNVVKKISRPNPPGRDLRKFESVDLWIAQLRMRRRKRRYLVEISTNLCADDRFWFSSSRRIEWYVFRSWATFRSRDSFCACAVRRNTYHSIRLDE